MNPRHIAPHNPDIAPIVRQPLETDQEIRTTTSELYKLVGDIGLKLLSKPSGLVIVEGAELAEYRDPASAGQLIQGHHLLKQKIEVVFDQAVTDTLEIGPDQSQTTISFVASRQSAEDHLLADRNKVLEILRLQPSSTAIFPNDFAFRLPMATVVHDPRDSEIAMSMEEIRQIHHEDLDVEPLIATFDCVMQLPR